MQFIERLVALYIISGDFLIVFAAHKQFSCFDGNCLSSSFLPSPSVPSAVLRGREREHRATPRSSWWNRKGGQPTAVVPLRSGSQVRGGPAVRITGLFGGLFSNQFALVATWGRVLPFQAGQG